MLADRMRQAATPKVAGPGQQAYTTPGTYTFTVPTGITSICAVCVGGGATANDSRAGMLCYSNNISTTPGESLTVVVGVGGIPPYGTPGFSRISRSSTALINALGGGQGGTAIGDFSGSGGSPRDNGGQYQRSGGGGAGGYTNADGYQVGQNVLGGWGGGAYGSSTAGLGGAGGGGGSGGYFNTTVPNDYFTDTFSASGGGGGVGILGLGSSGSAGLNRTGAATTLGGGGGGGGSSGDNGGAGGNGDTGTGGNGGAFGGAAGQGAYSYTYVWDPELYDWVFSSSTGGSNGAGAGGAVRIIWGAGRSYPSNAANV